MGRKNGQARGSLWYTLGLSSLVLLLLIHGELASQAMIQGIDLCLQTVIPSLFPLMVASRLLMNTDLPQQLGKAIGSVMGPLFRLPKESAICLVLGLLGGYPVGAQTIALSWKQGRLTRNQAEHMLSFCNTASPSFVFGIVGALLGRWSVAMVLYLIHVVSAVLVGILLRPRQAEPQPNADSTGRKETSGGSALYPSIRAMATICGYILLFQVISTLLEQIPGQSIPHWVSIGLNGLLELSGGCIRLGEMSPSLWRLCLASGFLAFGGLCVWMQIRSVIADSGLQGRRYFLGKGLHGLTAILLTLLVHWLAPGLLVSTQQTISLPNHQGLPLALIWVFVSAGILLGIWCLILRNKAGKGHQYVV